MSLVDSLFEEASFGLALVDRDLRCLRVNEVLAQINGLPAEEHVGREVSEVIPDLPEAVAEASRRVLETGEPVVDLDVPGPVDDDVGQRWFRCSYHPLREGHEVTGIWTSVHEVTLARRAHAAEQALGEEQRVLAEVFARAPTGLALLWGPELHVRAFNREILAHAPRRGPVLGLPVAEVFPEVADPARAVADAVIARGETLELEDVALPFGGDGSIKGRRHYSFSIVPVPGPDGGPAGALVAGRETTEEVRRREALEHELDEEHRIATELQVSLMPERLPEVPGAELASGFRPAGDGHEIGGDFFDVFALADGCHLVVIGDVCGKGATAASLTALARYTIRAAAIQEGGEPREALVQLNEAILRQRDDMRFLTCVCAFVEEGDRGGLRLTICVAGHPPPLHVDADGAVTRVGGRGALIGAWERPDLTEETVELRPGERLVLYTDGVVEAGAPGRSLGDEGLAAVLQGVPDVGAGRTVAAIERAVAESSDGPPRDDVAVLVVRAQPGRGGG